jgi:hypothetical protein
MFKSISMLDPQFKGMHNHLFPISNRSQRWIEWWHHTVNLGRVRVYGAYSFDQLVGMWCVESRSLMYNGKVIPVGRCFSVGIHEQYREKGLFIGLGMHALEEERKIGEYDYVLGFPTKDRPVVHGHIHAGWKISQEIDVCSVIVDEYMDRGDDYLREDFGHWQSMIKSPSQTLFPKEGSFVNWNRGRWVGHPQVNYITLSNATTTAVVKQYKGWAHVLSLEGYTKQGVAKMLRCIKALGKRHQWTHINLWAAENQMWKEEMTEAGFVNKEEPRLILSYNINATREFKLTTSNIQMGIEEGY